MEDADERLIPMQTFTRARMSIRQVGLVREPEPSRLATSRSISHQRWSSSWMFRFARLVRCSVIPCNQHQSPDYHLRRTFSFLKRTRSATVATLFLLRAIPFGVEFCTPEEKQKKKKIPKGDQPRSTGNAFDDSLFLFTCVLSDREKKAHECFYPHSYSLLPPSSAHALSP